MPVSGEKYLEYWQMPKVPRTLDDHQAICAKDRGLTKGYAAISRIPADRWERLKSTRDDCSRFEMETQRARRKVVRSEEQPHSADERRRAMILSRVGLISNIHGSTAATGMKSPGTEATMLFTPLVVCRLRREEGSTSVSVCPIWLRPSPSGRFSKSVASLLTVHARAGKLGQVLS